MVEAERGAGLDFKDMMAARNGLDESGACEQGRVVACPVGETQSHPSKT